MASRDAIRTELRSLTRDDIEGNGRLDEILEKIRESPDMPRYAEDLFRLMERFPDADFGCPGAIVHLLEKMSNCDAELERSIRRSPTAHTVWMMNRTINPLADGPDKEKWMALLEGIARNASLPADVTASARDFVEYQKEVARERGERPSN